MKICYALALGLSVSSVPAVAQDAAPAAQAAITPGAMIVSADGRRVGRIDRVLASTVSLIYNGRFIQIPTATLTPSDRGYTTTLTKADLAKL
ncbi:putative metalloprotease with PDZ domain [Sphingomonas zeicaulis]|uniref:hypothetical protein n=1 Tax=Sphingomonas zeicaulis TaxID=1632740 RepID=UPI003D24BF33